MMTSQLFSLILDDMLMMLVLNNNIKYDYKVYNYNNARLTFASWHAIRCSRQFFYTAGWTAWELFAILLAVH